MGQTELVLDATLLGGEDEAELQTWLVEDGGGVDGGQSVVELETSKAIVDVPAPVAGTLRHRASVGELIAAGGVLGVIEHD